MKTALERFAALVPGNEVVSARDFVAPAKDGDAGKRAVAQWAGELAEGARA
jgi:hypothetical protein